MRLLRQRVGQAGGILSVVLLLALALTFPVHAEDDDEATSVSGPNWGAKTLDAALLRPIYFGQTVVGAAMFGVALPFTLISGSDDRQIAYETFVETPADETFRRPLGSF
ncbi:MAG: hypothetical protein VX252_14685 [Myxococcota bacterium]|nr:hypothetical protein [Myxococcota bacterium]